MNGSMAQSDTKNNHLIENRGKSGKMELECDPTEQCVTISTASSTSYDIAASPSPGPPPASKKQLQLAILTHIQAIRALGRTEINTQEIADALCIYVQEVNDALEVLKKQGVRRR